MEPAMLFTKLQLHWGYITRVPGASASQPAYLLPPPTTVVGAYTNPLARLLGEPDSLHTGTKEKPRRGRGPGAGLPRILRCSLEATLAAGAGLLGTVGAVSVEEPSRILGGPYKGGGSYDRATRSPPYLGVQEVMPVQALGHTTAPGALLAMAWLVDVAQLARCMALSVEETHDALEASAWAVYRVGSREGLSSVVEAGFDPRPVVGEGIFASILYQRTSCATPLPGEFTVRVTLNDTGYTEALYHVPALGSASALAPQGPARFESLEACRYAAPRDARDLGLAFRARG